MSLFCGKKCKCKKRCKSDLAFNKTALKGCYAACKTDQPPVDGDTYLSGLPQAAKNVLNAQSNGGIAGEDGYEEYQAENGGNSLLLIGVGLVVVVLGFIYLKKR